MGFELFRTCNECIQSDYNLMFTFSRANGRHFLMSCGMIARRKPPEISLCIFLLGSEAYYNAALSK